MRKVITLPGMNDYANAALTAFFLGVAEAHTDVTSYQDKHAEVYDLGRELGCALLGRNDEVPAQCG